MVSDSHETSSSVTVLNYFHHSDKKGKDNLETQAEAAVLCVHAENQAIIEPILLYYALKCKETKEQSSEDYL